MVSVHITLPEACIWVRTWEQGMKVDGGVLHDLVRLPVRALQMAKGLQERLFGNGAGGTKLLGLLGHQQVVDIRVAGEGGVVRLGVALPDAPQLVRGLLIGIQGGEIQRHRLDGYLCVRLGSRVVLAISLPEGPRVEARMISAFPGASMLRLAGLGSRCVVSEAGDRHCNCRV